MKKQIAKIIAELIIVELLYLITLQVLYHFIAYESNETIYLVNINLHFIISYLIWRIIKSSKVNRDILIILGVWFTVSTAESIFFLFSGPNFSVLFNYINFHIINVFTTMNQLFFTFYIFLLSLVPHKKKSVILLNALLFSLLVCVINFGPMFITGEFMDSYLPLFSKSYIVHILNFCLLIVFWHQYTQSRLIFSEYLSSIISAYTILIGLQIFHVFSSENDLIFYYFGQYFNTIIFLIMIFALFSRWIYLLDPNSIENEKYIENYYLLKGFINKPRRSYFIEFYSNFKRSHVIIAVSVIILLGVYLFFFNKFIIFIRLNLLILMLSAIVSLILAILTWYNRWYSSVGFFFHQGEK